MQPQNTDYLTRSNLSKKAWADLDSIRMEQEKKSEQKQENKSGGNDKKRA